MDKLTCSVLDRGRTRFFYVEYDSKFFDLYDVEEVQSVCVFLEDIYKLLKLANKTDTLSLVFKEDVFVAELISDGNKRMFEFILPTDFIETPNFPNASLPYKLDLSIKEMKQSVKDISLLGNSIFQLVLSRDTVTLMSDNSAESSEFSSVKYAQVIESEVDIDDVFSIRFNLDYISQMLKFNKISKEVSIEVSEQALFYKLEDDIMGVCVRGMIAPRVEIEE
jgi:hypothetical protein